MEQQIKRSPRIEVVDALRGFAVIAIALVHSLEHFIYPVYPEVSPSWLHALDEGVFQGTFALLAGKSYAIFALLFGFTFFIQTNNQKRRGGDFGYRFLWRLILLAGFATLNAAFFPAGDVLLLFTAVGLILFLTRNWRDRAILIAAIFFLLQPVEWYHYIATLIDPSHRIPELRVGQMYAEVAEYTKAGNFWEFIKCNVTLGQKASFLWAVDAGRYLQTAGLFLLGFYLGRKELFVTTERNLKFWTKALIIGAISFAPLYVFKEMAMDGELYTQKTIGTIFDMWQKLAFTFVLVSSFILLYQNERFNQMVSNLRCYGRMSLTNYITQSIFGALIFFPIGLHLAPYCGYSVSLLIGFGIVFIQLQFSKWWLSRHRQGPLEYIWHKWTWIGDKSRR